MWLANPHSILRGGFSLSRAKAVFIPPAELVVVARSSYPKENPTRNLTILRGILVRSRELESLALWLKEPTGQSTLILEASSLRHFCAKHRDFLPGNFCTLCRILQVRVPIASLETVQKQCRNRALTFGQIKNDDFWSMTWWRFEWPQSQIWYTGRKMPTRLRSSQGNGHFCAGG